MNEPLGDGSWGPFFLRVTLGAYFFLAGWVKVSHLDEFIRVVKEFHLISPNMANIYGSLLPYMEITVGGFLILGLWMTLSAILASLMLLSFVLAFGFFPESTDIFNKDVVLLASAISLMFSGPGAYSIDGLRVPRSG